MRRWVCLAAVVLTCGACDETPTTPSRLDLAGRWLVTSLRPAATAPLAPPDGAVLAIEFAGDRVVIFGDCNVCSGRYALEGDALTVSPLACTRRACPAGSLDDPFFTLIEGAERASLAAGPVLILDGRRGRIVARR